MIIFETERLIVREWTPDDIEAAFRLYGDPEVMRYLAAPPPGVAVADLAQMRERMQQLFDSGPKLRPMGLWAIQKKADSSVVGSILVKPIQTTDVIEIGWHLARAEWGQGLATEAALAARDYAFEIAGVDDLVAIAIPENEPSLAVMRRIGLKDRGFTDRFHDYRLALFGLTREEWASRLSQSD